MDFLGAEWAYILLVLFGAFAVGVHAYSMYGQRVSGEEAEGSKDLLASMALPAVAGRDAFRQGFVFYLTATETLYLILTSSSVILELSLDALGRNELVGALSSVEQLNPIVPILASSVIITASQLRPLAEVERAIRGIAHRIAGIPRNLDGVQAQIRSLDIHELARSLEKGEAKANSGQRKKNRLAGDNSTRLVENAQCEAAHIQAAAEAAGLRRFESETFGKSLERVLCLYEWTLGYDGEQIWIGDDVSQITSLFESYALEFAVFRGDLQKRCEEGGAQGEARSESLAESWEKLLSECLKLESRLTILLSLLLINRPNVELRKYALLGIVRDKVLEAEQGIDRHARRAFATSLLGGTFAAYVLVTLYLALEKLYRDWQKVNESVLATLAPYGEPIVGAEFSLLGSLTWLGDRMDNAIFETLDFVAIFGVSVAIALAIRQARMAMLTWPLREDATIAPAGTYLYVGLLAYVPSMLVFLMLKFFTLNIVQPLMAGTAPLGSASLSAFPDYLPEILFVPTTAFVCVWFVFGYLDRDLWRHRAMAPTAIWLAMLCGSINLGQKMIRGAFITTTDPVAAFLVPFVVFVSLFGIFARVYQRQILTPPHILRRFNARYRYRRLSRVRRAISHVQAVREFFARIHSPGAVDQPGTAAGKNTRDAPPRREPS